jgi:hypothetical protein
LKRNKKPKFAHNPGTQKQPKIANSPKKDKSVRLGGNPDSYLRAKPAWQFHKRDIDHPQWGWGILSPEEFITILNDYLCNFETMSWDEILKTSGGRTQGTNHHNINVSDCCPDAQKRLLELKMDDIDELFSLRLNGKCRLWGIKEGQILRFLWFDKEHNVYPLKH